MEGVWGEVRGPQKSAKELTEITEGLQSTVEGSELRVGATVLMHGLVSRGDLNSQMGLPGPYDETKGRWAVSYRRARMSGLRGGVYGPQMG